MKVGFASLDTTDRLTEKELPLLENDEWVDIRKRRSYTRDGDAEFLAYRKISAEEAEIRGAPETEDEWRLSPGEVAIQQFEYMAVAWHIFDPQPDGTRKKAGFTPENRAKFVNLHGAHLAAQLAIRGGGIAPDMSGKVDPDTGEKLEFPEDAGVPAGKGVARSRAAASIHPA